MRLSTRGVLPLADLGRGARLAAACGLVSAVYRPVPNAVSGTQVTYRIP